MAAGEIVAVADSEYVNDSTFTSVAAAPSATIENSNRRASMQYRRPLSAALAGIGRRPQSSMDVQTTTCTTPTRATHSRGDGSLAVTQTPSPSGPVLLPHTTELADNGSTAHHDGGPVVPFHKHLLESESQVTTYGVRRQLLSPPTVETVVPDLSEAAASSLSPEATGSASEPAAIEFSSPRLSLLSNWPEALTHDLDGRDTFVSLENNESISRISVVGRLRATVKAAGTVSYSQSICQSRDQTGR